MKAKPLKMADGSYAPCEPTEATHVQLNMPGPIPSRIIPVQVKGPRKGLPNWTWNGDVDKPTLKPSIRSFISPKEIRCHSSVSDGQVQFLSDCTHEFAGQTLDLLDVE
jgi:hypothetical protein